MKIGIIGAGKIGGTLARRLAGLGHQVEIANSRGPETLGEFAGLAGVTAVPVTDVVKGKDVIVVTIQEKRVSELPKGLFAGVPASVPVIDTCNYYPRERDGRIEPIEAGMTERPLRRGTDRPPGGEGVQQHRLGQADVARACRRAHPAGWRCRSAATIRRPRPR